MKKNINRFLKLFFTFYLFLFIKWNIVAGAMSVPRKIYLLKTKYFDILFSNPSSTTAKNLADNADRLYEIARSELEGANDLRIPVIISPDSDRLSVDYTSSPYNRIVIFDGVPEIEDTNFQNALSGLFYHEVYLALSQSIRNPLNQRIYETVGGDGYQPISLMYLPFSFVEARAFLAEGKDLDLNYKDILLEADDNNELSEDFIYDKYDSYKYGKFHDKFFLEILSIAKYENKFPNWLQAGAERDIYPGKILNEAAGTAFAAYLIQAYGVDKYIEFWNECGELNLVFMSDIFKKVYGKHLTDLWNEFEDSVPLPKDLDKIKELDKQAKNVFLSDTEGVSSNLIISDYGLVWYDDIRHEVDILDWNNPFIMRQLLFLADGVKKLSLSPDGRYLVVSFYGIKTRPEFRNDKVWIYDLHTRSFLDYDFRLRDGTICKTESGKYALAGIYVRDKKPELQIYDFEYDDNKASLLYKKEFSKNQYPNSITYAGNGRVSYILSENNRHSFFQYDFNSKIEKSWDILLNEKPINIRNLRLIKTKKISNSDDENINKLENKNVYTFEYFLSDEPSFARMGVILLNEDFEPKKVYFQDVDLGGGVKYPIIFEDSLFYCSNKFSFNQIKYIPVDKVSFKEGKIKEVSLSGDNDNKEPEIKYSVEEIERADAVSGEKESLKILDEYELFRYNPLKYMFHCSFRPFMAIKDLAVKEEQKLFPSLGGTFITQYDPFMNNRIMISGSGAYIKLDFRAVSNPTVDDINDKKYSDIDDKKNISFGISFENTSTPVDFKAGCLFKFNLDGEYNFSSNLNAFLQVPIGMAFSKINFNILTGFTASTDYYDSNLSGHYPSLKDWPRFKDAYETVNFVVDAEYSNMHQYGISRYERRGFSLGLKLYSFWDISEIRFLNDKYSELQQALQKGENSGLTQAQIDTFYDERIYQISQLCLGISCDVNIPRITPFGITNGFVLSAPTTIGAELFNNVGTALHVSAETLLLGYESQDGFPFLYLYFSRLGLKFGYDLNLNYDTYEVPLPDIRVKNNIWNVFTNTYIRDSLYLIYDMDFCETIGRLSQYPFKLSMKGEYFLRSKGFAFTLKLSVAS